MDSFSDDTPDLLHVYAVKIKNFAFLCFLLLSLSTCKKFEREAKLKTGTVSDIMTTTAKATGDIIDLGSGITDHGHCWGSTTNPTIYGSKTSLGATSNTGIFESNLSNLGPGIIYHTRAYAISKGEVLYGLDVSFTTPPNPVYVSAAIGNATPSILEMTYNLTLANIVPATSAFNVQVNSVIRTVNSVAISGTKVMLTLASAVVYGDIVTVAYTKPATNPLQTASGGQTATISAMPVTNNVSPLPVYVSSVVENATPALLEMTYSLTLANIVPATSAFSVMVNSVTRTVNSVAISGAKVMLTLSSAVVYGDIVSVAYTKPAANPLQTALGGQAATISAQAVTNNVTYVAPVNPVYVSSVIQNTTPSLLEMTYNLTLANIAPSASAFTVMVNSVARTVNTVSISGTKVMLTLSSAVVYGDIVTVAYTKPATNPLQTALGGQAATISAQAVTNNVTYVAPVNPVYVSSVIQNTTPSLLEMTYNLTLANIAPSASAFTVMVNSVARTVNTVSISGTKVMLTLSSAVVYGDIVTVAYTKPATNPLQTASGGQAAAISVQPVTNNVNPTQVPGAPTIGTATPGNGQATVTFTAPTSNGGSAITGYTVTSSPGSNTATGLTSPITVTGLTNGMTYTFTVVATNANGPGLPSSPSNSVIPFLTVWSENFEVYNAGTFPSSSWTADGNATDLYNNYINNSISYDGNKSLQLFGTIGGCWEGIAYHNLNATPTFEVEFAVRNGNEVLSGCNPDGAVVGLREGLSWANPSRTFIRFDGDGKVYSGGGAQIGSYNSNTWYLIKIRYERISTSQIRLTYWINNNSSGFESLNVISEENLLNNLELGVLEGSAWFDSIKIIQY